MILRQDSKDILYSLPDYSKLLLAFSAFSETQRENHFFKDEKLQTRGQDLCLFALARTAQLKEHFQTD